MKKILSLLFLVPCLLYAKVDPLSISQHRHPNETLQQSLNRIKKTVPATFLVRENPINKKGAIRDIDFSLAPKVATYDELMQMFHLVRDSRFLYENNKSDFERRISWLYPDDGCFSRAAMMGIKLEKEHFIRPAKIFSFGELMVNTQYSSEGAVYWWYHVAGVVNYMGAMYVLDPALNSEGPILVDDWYQIMGTQADLQGVVCNEYTYSPFDYCYTATRKSEATSMQDQASFLEKEWQRMHYLGLDPAKILGDNPPWN